MRKLLNQPLLQFFLIGAAVFALYALMDDGEPVPNQPRIAVSDRDALLLANQFERLWQRQPSAEELAGLIDEFVSEEIYVREALALGLDQGDSVIRGRLRQKMEFLTEAGAEAAELDDAVLEKFYADNADAFAAAARIGFTQILIPDAQPSAAENILAELADGADPADLGQRTLLPARMPVSPETAVDGTFGAGFFERLSELPAGEWSGPIPSGYGQHIVRLDVLEPGRLPPFVQVRDRLELEWRSRKAEELRAERFEELKAQYAIDLPDPATVLAR